MEEKAGKCFAHLHFSSGLFLSVGHSKLWVPESGCAELHSFPAKGRDTDGVLRGASHAISGSQCLKEKCWKRLESRAGGDLD